MLIYLIIEFFYKIKLNKNYSTIPKEIIIKFELKKSNLKFKKK